MKNSKKKYKFSIIEPFFKKEKKLKDIEEETNISYATLKRWVSQYKSSGIEGLSKKERSDKNKSKKIDDETMQQLKVLYKQNYNLPLTKLYDKAKHILLNCNTMISYPTFFRIINNLDDNIKKKSIPSVKKSKVSHYGIIQKAVPIPFFNNQNKIFYLTLFYDKEDLKIINFIFEEEKKEFINLLDFIRESIIISEDYPKYISLDPKILGVTKNIVKKIYFESKINLVQEELTRETVGFISYIDFDILKEFNKKKPDNIYELKEFIRKYFFIEDLEKDKKIPEEYRDQLNVFLKESNRKVYSYGVRVKNFIYDAEFFSKFENKVVKVFYGNIFREKVLIYQGDQFLGEAIKKN